MMDESQPTTHEGSASQRWATAPPPHARRPQTDWERVSRVWFIVLALVILSISVLAALIAADQAVEIWLQPQYAPFVRLGGALVVAALALFVVVRMTRRGS